MENKTVNNQIAENIIAVFFQVESEAYQAFSEIKRDPYNQSCVVSQVALIKKENGRIIPCEGFDTGLKTGDDTWFGGLIGGLIGLLGGPLGVLLGGSVGLLVGSAVDAKDSFQSASLLQQVSTKMGDGQVALLALAQESNTMLFNAKLANFDVNIVRYDASEVQEEVEEAKQLQKEMEEQTRQAMRIQRSEERKAKVEKHRQKIKENFEEFKQKHNLN